MNNDIYVIDLDPNDKSASLARIRNLVTQTGAPSVAFMVTAVPNEQPLDDRLPDWVHRFSYIQQGLRDLPVKVGILIQALIGHGDRKRLVGDPPFQPIVGADGTAARESFCPLDEGFQAYTHQLIHTLAQTEPAFFLIDDDFRLDHHDPAIKGCMCPLHLDYFAQTTGTQLSREALVAGLNEANNDTLRDQWESVKQASLVELASVIRQAIDSVDQDIPGYFCCVSSEVHYAPAIAKTLASNHAPLVRINNAVYLEGSHKGFPQRISRTFRQIAECPDDTTILTEADTCPHTRYSLSVKSHLAHITATILAGCHGAKYWFHRTEADGWQDTAPFRKLLSQLDPYLHEVETIRDQVTWSGPTILGRASEPQRKPLSQRKDMDFPSSDWGWRIFGRMGIPFTVGTQAPSSSGISALSGTAPLAYKGEEMRELLSGSLLLDGEAAWYFCQKGFAEYLGVSAEPADFPCAVELLHAIPESRRTQDTSTSITGSGRYLLRTASSTTRVVSSFATGSPAGYTPTAPALTWFENELGGRVAVYGISMHAPLDWIFYNRKCKTQLTETLTWLAHGVPPVMVQTDLDVFVLHGQDKVDPQQETICLFNLNPDTIEGVSITLPGKPVSQIERLTTSGTWQPVEFSMDGQTVHCTADAATMEPFILRLER